MIHNDYLKSLQYVEDPNIDTLFTMTTDVILKIKQHSKGDLQ